MTLRLILALAVAIGGTLHAAGETPYDEFDDLQAQLARWRADPARAKVLAEQVYHPQAVFLGDDGDPLDVVLRRTRALLDHPALAKGVNVFKGKVTCKPVAEALNYTYHPLETLI